MRTCGMPGLAVKWESDHYVAEGSRLTFIKRVSPKGTKKHKARYRCRCGNETVLDVYDAKSGHTRSCGCLNQEQRPRTAGIVEFEGHKGSVFEIIKAVKPQVSLRTVYRRLSQGLTLRQALTTPANGVPKRHDRPVV